MEKLIRVKILNHEYLLRSDEDDALVQEIAQFVNDKLMEIGNSTNRLSETKMAILAAFHIANDHFQLIREQDVFKRDIENRARSLNSRIDAVTK